MAPVDGFEFRRLLRALDAAAFERFVADLWRARGWAVEREGETLVAEHPTLDDRRSLDIRAVPWWRPGTPSPGPTDADLLVVNWLTADRSGSVVDVDDLHDALRYAVDAEARADLLETHLHRPGWIAGWAIRRAPRREQVRPAAVTVALAVLLVAAAGVAFLPVDQPAAGSDGTGDGAALDVSDVERETPDSFAATRWPGGAGGFPLGLAPDGVEDPAALASTHADRAGSRPYELELTVREFEGGQLVGSYEERIAVRSDWTFVSWVDVTGDLQADHPVISAVEMYSAGNGVFLHVGPDRSLSRRDALVASPGDVVVLENRVERYLVAALSLDESAVVDTSQIGDTTFHRVNGTAATPGGASANVTALVTAGGTVHEVRVERDVAGADGSVVVSMEYEFGSVDVEPPVWLGNDSATVWRNLPLSKR